MSNNSSFLRISSIAAFISAFTTFLLWFLPKLYLSPKNFEDSILLYNNTYYMLRLWVNFIHIPLALTAYFGLVLILFQRQPAKSVFGMIWFIVWGLVEMVGIGILLVSVNFNWRKNYELADELKRNVLKNNIEAFFSIWDSMFLVLLVAFLLGSLFIAWATWHSKGIEKVLSYLLWLAVPLTLLIILSNYANQNWAGEIIAYIYPILQPASRALLGLFIWRSIAK